MKLLDFHIPPYARIQWASKQILDEWEPRMNLARQASMELETLAVKHGLRDCATTSLTDEQLVEKKNSFAEHGLFYIPIYEHSGYRGSSHYHPRPNGNKRRLWYTAIAKDKAKGEEFVRLTLHEKDQEKKDTGIAGLLGYPDCCIQFYNEVFVKQKYYDPMWQIHLNTNKDFIKKKSDTSIKLRETIPQHGTILLRNAALKIVPHFPCSPTCEHALRIADDWVELARKENLPGIEELIEFLSMPIEWDALKGIAYITTPIFKIETNSVPCYPNYVVQKEGTFYPKDAPNGLKFPWTEAWKFNGLSGCHT